MEGKAAIMEGTAAITVRKMLNDAEAVEEELSAKLTEMQRVCSLLPSLFLPPRSLCDNLLL